jgi:hypothetical protein
MNHSVRPLLLVHNERLKGGGVINANLFIEILVGKVTGK